jgi:hypothetical protein
VAWLGIPQVLILIADKELWSATSDLLAKQPEERLQLLAPRYYKSTLPVSLLICNYQMLADNQEVSENMLEKISTGKEHEV